MERAGNGDTDPDAERRGLGTPATRAAVIEKLVKGGFAERKGKQLISTRNGAALISVLPDMLTSPQLTAEWENNLTQIAKGAADPGEFLSGIEVMARELVQTHTVALDGKKDLFREEMPSVGKCSGAVPPSMRGRKTIIAAIRNVSLPCGRMTAFSRNARPPLPRKIAAALLKSGKANQSSIDKSTEVWLDYIEEKLSYEKWYCGHYHTEKKIDKLEIMFENFDEFCSGVK